MLGNIKIETDSASIEDHSTALEVFVDDFILATNDLSMKHDDDDAGDDDKWEFPISSTDVEFVMSILGSFEGGVKKLVILIDFFVGDLFN